jgi:hypothetical protein
MARVPCWEWDESRDRWYEALAVPEGQVGDRLCGGQNINNRHTLGTVTVTVKFMTGAGKWKRRKRKRKKGEEEEGLFKAKSD